MEQFDSKYFRGQGTLMLGDVDSNGDPDFDSLVFIGDVTSADLTPQISRDQIIENRTGQGAVGSSWKNSSQYSLAMQLRSVRQDHLALALQGTSTAKAAASVTDESHTANHGKFISLEHNQVSAVVVTNDTGATTYTADTDYVLHAEDGVIEILATGTIVDASTVLIDYSHAAQHHIKVNPANLKKCLQFFGINTANNDKRMRCEIYRIAIDESVLSFITDSASDMPMNGVVELVGTRPAGDQLFNWKVED